MLDQFLQTTIDARIGFAEDLERPAIWVSNHPRRGRTGIEIAEQHERRAKPAERRQNRSPVRCLHAHDQVGRAHELLSQQLRAVRAEVHAERDRGGQGIIR